MFIDNFDAMPSKGLWLLNSVPLIKIESKKVTGSLLVRNKACGLRFSRDLNQATLIKGR